MELLFSPSDFKHRAQMFIAKPRAEKIQEIAAWTSGTETFPL